MSEIVERAAEEEMAEMVLRGISMGLGVAAKAAEAMAEEYRLEGKDEIVGALTALAKLLRQ